MAAARRRPCVHLARCDGAICPTWLDIEPKPAAVERAAKHSGHRRVAIPAHFEHSCFVACQIDGGLQPSGRATGMKDKVAVAYGFRALQNQPRTLQLIPLG